VSEEVAQTVEDQKESNMCFAYIQFKCPKYHLPVLVAHICEEQIEGRALFLNCEYCGEIAVIGR
jgi:hypothetical protein